MRGMTELNRDVGAPQTADLVAALEEQLAPRRGTLAPSQVWCVFDRTGIAASGGFGPAAAAPLDTAFRIASCTKSFTSATALLLERDGVLDLDAPLDELLGEHFEIRTPSPGSPGKNGRTMSPASSNAAATSRAAAPAGANWKSSRSLAHGPPPAHVRHCRTPLLPRPTNRQADALAAMAAVFRTRLRSPRAGTHRR